MKKIFVIMLCLIGLVACGKTTFTLSVDVLSNPDVMCFYADEKIIPVGDYIYVDTNSELKDTMIFVLEDGEKESNDNATYLTQGITSKIEVEKGKLYKIGILNKEEYKNLTSLKTFTIKVKGVEVLIED